MAAAGGHWAPDRAHSINPEDTEPAGPAQQRGNRRALVVRTGGRPGTGHGDKGNRTAR